MGRIKEKHVLPAAPFLRFGPKDKVIPSSIYSLHSLLHESRLSSFLSSHSFQLALFGFVIPRLFFVPFRLGVQWFFAIQMALLSSKLPFVALSQA